MQLVKLFISSLLVAIIVLAACGIAWWGHPPEKVAANATGGQVILAMGILGSAFALWSLWFRDASAEHSAS